MGLFNSVRILDNGWRNINLQVKLRVDYSLGNEVVGNRLHLTDPLYASPKALYHDVPSSINRTESDANAM